MTEEKTVGWNFDNSYARLPKSLFSNVKPSPVSSPMLIKLNESLARELGLDIQALKSDENIEVFAGNDIPEGAFPLAQAYAGHQFGHFNMLGDGRAVLLGEHITANGERVDVQLKGSGRTPYSRGGDGRAALGPMLREYIISEAMHALGIPTTRSLAVVTTGDPIYREDKLQGAILTRVAASHIRVGTFQYVAAFQGEKLRELADYTINRHYPHIEDNENKYLKLLQEVIKRQAKLIAQWQLVGFIHGVMNTDNMTISGETIDYGPCAFMDTYHPETVFSSIDVQGRYAYVNQPYMAGWNLARFAESLLGLLHEEQEEAVKIAQVEITNYNEIYQSHWQAGMRAKLGLFNEEEEDKILIDNLLGMMQMNKADYTNTFRALTLNDPQKSSLFSSSEFSSWYESWRKRLGRQEESLEAAHELMQKTNPAVIPRNHRVEEALEAAEKGDYGTMERLLAILSNPFTYTAEQEAYCTLPGPSDQPYQTFCGT